MPKYVYAVIKIPLEITNGDKYNPLTEYSSVSFEECAELPEKKMNVGNRLKHFLNSLSSKEPEKEQEKEVVKKEEGEPEKEPEKDEEKHDSSEWAQQKEEEPTEVKLVVLKSDIKKHKSPRVNSSFKHKSSSNLRHTMKTYS
jgi:hypothetical protein